MAANQSPALDLFELKQEDFHKLWPFLLRGLANVKRDLKPNWLPEDLYSALRAQQVNCVIARRGDRLLGFQIYSKQLRAFNFEPELFIWVAWDLPLKEWRPEDDMPGMVRAMWEYVANVAKTQYGTSEVSWITRPGRARGFTKKFGWRPSWVTINVRV